MSQKLPSVIVTERQVENEETGLDLYMYGEQQTFASKRTIRVQVYTLVVVSNLPVFNSNSGQTVQFTVDKYHSEIEKLHQSLCKKFPGTLIPDLPNKPIAILDTVAKAKERKRQLTHFFTFCAKTPKIAKSEVILAFLGVSNTQEEDELPETNTEHADSKVEEKQHDAKRTLFKPSIEIDNDELFAEEKEDTDEEIELPRSAAPPAVTPRRAGNNVKLFEATEMNVANLHQNSAAYGLEWQSEGSQSPDVGSEEEDSIDHLVQRVEAMNKMREVRKAMVKRESITSKPARSVLQSAHATNAEEVAELSIDDISQYFVENTCVAEEADLGL